MDHKKSKSVSLSAKGGDVSSITEVAAAASSAPIGRPPAEALLSYERPSDATKRTARRELKVLFDAMRKSSFAFRIFLLGGGAALVLCLKVSGEIRMNIWSGAFYRGVEHKDMTEVWRQCGYFGLIVAVMLPLVVSHNWLLERLKIRVREWLSQSLLDEWTKPALAYRLNMTSAERLNPDQRIQEDVRNFSDMSCDLLMGIVSSTLMLVSFIGILWFMSQGITLNLFGKPMLIPGYMVWFALIYAGIGSYLAARVGRPLITLNEERYTREANFRYSLVRVSENAESIAFYGGEKDERKIVDQSLGSVLSLGRILSSANARLTSMVVGHGWFVVILPPLIAFPGFLQGKLDFGGLMMVVGAFNQVQQSLRWFVENFGKIADWRAALHRVTDFREALLTVDEYEESPEVIQLQQHAKGHLAFEKTGISLMDGQVVIAHATAEIMPGERVLLAGESGSGKSTILRAVGGLWPWGSGKIELPPKDEMMFLPQKPYIPLGTLAMALSYPNSAHDWDRKDMEAALTRVNLAEFIPMLDAHERWDKLMSLGQQQRLAFARLVLHKPKWAFLDEATSALDDENQERVMSVFLDELKDSALISVAHRQGLERYHTRTLQLVQTKSGRVLSKKAKPEIPVETTRNFLKRLGVALKITGESST